MAFNFGFQSNINNFNKLKFIQKARQKQILVQKLIQINKYNNLMRLKQKRRQNYYRALQIRNNINLINDNDTNDNVINVNTSNPKVINTFEIPEAFLHNLLSIASDGEYVWITNSNGQNLSRISISDNSVTQIPFSDTGVYSYGLSVDKNYVWVSNTLNNCIYRIDKTDLTSLELSSDTFNHPNYLFSDGTFVWVINSDLNTISKIIIDNLTVTEISSNTFNEPTELYSDGKYLWVKNHHDNLITQIDCLTGLTINNIDDIIINNDNETSNSVNEDEINEEGIISNNNFIWVVNKNTNSLLKIDTTNFANKYDIPLKYKPSGGLAFDTKYIWITNNEDNSVTQIDINKGEILTDKINVGLNPIGISSDNTFVWVANWHTNTITQIKINN
jgi:streptogramin lyase